MEEVIYNQIIDKIYLGIITLLDYDTSVQKCLSKIKICTQNRSERKISVDLALKVGINGYRFVSYNITNSGKILFKTSTYITPCDDLVKLANSFLKQKSDILYNSMLPIATQNSILQN